jgi:2-polyprenyl-3-methyl-5-hydroxy-6-metoxy-1,4-benzoquinol methylase
MGPTRIDPYSPEYKQLLVKDTEQHRRRTPRVSEDPLPWTYDPLECSLTRAWLYDLIIGSEFQRWDQAMRTKFGRPIQIVDIGCGPGGSSLWFAARGHDVVGIDACPERIAAANEVAARYADRIASAGGKLRYVCGNFFEFAPERCDAVISTKTFSHVPDVEALLLKYMEFMPPNGCFFVLDQIGTSHFASCSYYVSLALFPPYFCKTSWYRRQRAALGAVLRAMRILAPVSAMQPDDPFEGIGDELILPAFRHVFRKIDARNIDPLRVLEVANVVKDGLGTKVVLGPLVALNRVLQITGIGLEKGIVAHLEDRV